MDGSQDYGSRVGSQVGDRDWRKYEFSVAFGVSAACSAYSHPQVRADFELVPKNLLPAYWLPGAGPLDEALGFSLRHVRARDQEFYTGPPTIAEQEAFLTALPWE